MREAVKDLIPEGPYCYTYLNGEYHKCPFWSRMKGFPEQQNGYCALLERGDWEEGLTHLWDQVKECDINVE